jgi:uncharacterized peroxidase-related enzyme
MPHIALPDGVPGILSLFAARPDTAEPLRELADALLRGPSPLSRGERELIAAHVSRLNDCSFCCDSHSAFAAAQIDGSDAVVEAVVEDPGSAPIDPKLRALLAIAAKVQRGGRHVTGADVRAARAHGAGDDEIHDTVLIAAAFCMFNRYVDGLATLTPTDPAAYDAMGQRMAREGYARSGK